MVIGLDPERDQSEIERLGIEPLTLEFIDNVLAPKYAAAGFRIVEKGIIPAAEWPRLNTSWAKRLRGNERRPDYLRDRGCGLSGLKALIVRGWTEDRRDFRTHQTQVNSHLTAMM